MKPVEWRPQARRDAADTAWWFTRQAGVDLGLRFFDAVDAALSRLSRFHASGSMRQAHVAPDLPAPLRFLLVPGFERHLVYYLDLPDRILVVRIWNSARGLDALMTDPAEPSP